MAVEVNYTAGWDDPGSVPEDIVQGVLLLHPPSKSLFAREQNMNVSV